MQQSGGNTLHAPSMKTCFYLSLSTVWFHHMAVIPPLKVQALSVEQMAACLFTLHHAFAL